MVGPNLVQGDSTFGHEKINGNLPDQHLLHYWTHIAEDFGGDALLRMPLLVTISGPSGCGKRTLIKGVSEVLETENISLGVLKSATTRQFRNDDDYDQYLMLRYEAGVDLGLDHATERFMDLLESGSIIEHVCFQTHDETNWYGLFIDAKVNTRDDIVLAEVTLDAAKKVNDAFGPLVLGNEENAQVEPAALAFYILPSGGSIMSMLDDLEHRLSGRDDASGAIADSRIRFASSPIPGEIASVIFGMNPINYIIVNEKNENTKSVVAINGIANLIKIHYLEKLKIARSHMQ